MDIQLYRNGSLGKRRWTEIVGLFHDATIYQSWSYGSVRWGDKHLDHLVLMEKNNIVAAVQIVTKRIAILNAGIAYAYLGPMWHTRYGKRVEAFSEIIAAIREEYGSNNVIRIVPRVSENNEPIKNIFCEKAFGKNFRKSPYRTLILDLRPSLDEIRRGFKQKWRNQLNAAEKKDLKIYEGDENSFFETFLKLQRELLDRKRYVPGVDYDEFGKIQAQLERPQKMRIFICESEGEPVSSAVVSATGNSGIYLLGATGENGLKVKGSYLIQWKIIQWLKSIQCDWYDLGGVNPEGNPGVFLFKSGLSGDDVTYLGVYEYSKSKFLRSLLEQHDNFVNLRNKIRYFWANRQGKQ